MVLFFMHLARGSGAIALGLQNTQVWGRVDHCGGLVIAPPSLCLCLGTATGFPWRRLTRLVCFIMYPAALVEQARSVPSTYLGVLRGGKELGLWMGREGKGKVGGSVPSACSIDSVFWIQNL